MRNVDSRGLHITPTARKRGGVSIPTLANSTAKHTRVTQPTGMAPRRLTPTTVTVVSTPMAQPTFRVSYSGTHHVQAPLTAIQQRMVARALSTMFTAYHVMHANQVSAAAQRAKVMAKHNASKGVTNA